MYKKGLTAQRQMDLQAHQDYPGQPPPIRDFPMGDFRPPNDPSYPMRKLPPADKAGVTKPPAGDATGRTP